MVPIDLVVTVGAVGCRAKVSCCKKRGRRTEPWQSLRHLRPEKPELVVAWCLLCRTCRLIPYPFFEVSNLWLQNPKPKRRGPKKRIWYEPIGMACRLVAKKVCSPLGVGFEGPRRAPDPSFQRSAWCSGPSLVIPSFNMMSSSAGMGVRANLPHVNLVLGSIDANIHRYLNVSGDVNILKPHEVYVCVYICIYTYKDM